MLYIIPLQLGNKAYLDDLPFPLSYFYVDATAFCYLVIASVPLFSGNDEGSIWKLCGSKDS